MKKLFKYLTDWRYRYWSKKIKGMKKMIEDEKFSKYKALSLREEVRQEYDQEKSRLALIEEKIKNKKETIKELGKDEFERIKDEKVRADKRIEGLKRDMDQLTTKVFGGKPSMEHPAGEIGNDQTIEKLYDLIDTVKRYIK